MVDEAVPSPLVRAPSGVQPARLLTGALVALAVNVVAFAIGSAAGATWDVGQPYPITWVAVVAATVVAFAAAGAVTWLVSRKRPGFARFAAWAGLVFGLTSMLGLVNASGAATALSLGFMHVATAIAWFISVRPSSGTRAGAVGERWPA